MKHSGLGIASFAISILTGIALFFLIVAAAIMQTRPGGIDEKSVMAVVLGLFLIGGILVDILALGLGIAGLFQEERKKLFSILGISISGLTLFGMTVLFVIGLLVG